LFHPPTSHVRDFLGGMEEDEWSFPSSSSRGGKASMKLGKKLSDSIGEVEEDETGAKVDKVGAVGGCGAVFIVVS